jgi:hypothetical protein
LRVPPNFPFRKHTISKEVQKIVFDNERQTERETDRERDGWREGGRRVHLKSSKMADILVTTSEKR